MKDKRLLAILLALGLITHLFALSQPREVIFDEVHFGKFITAYSITGQRFFDIHPPHAKLMIAAAAWLGGYRTAFNFENISEPYGTAPILPMRLLPALAGVVLPLVIYVLLRQLGVAWPLAFLGGWAMVFDNALTIQTRMISLDGILLTATFGSFCAWLKAEKAAGRPSGRASLAAGRAFWWWLVFAGALAGLAVGTKFTGLSALALLGVLTLVRMWQHRRRGVWVKWLAGGLLVLVSALVVYASGWALHFALLPHDGSGDAFLKPDFSGAPLPIAFVRETIKLHQVMFNANYNLTAGHPYASPWWLWPVMGRSVYYWHGAAGGDIYFLGNPIVWWGAGLLFVLAVANTIVDFGQAKLLRTKPHLQGALWITGLAFVISMAPLMRVPRALFLYHYLTPLIFSLIFGLQWLTASGLFGSKLRQGEKIFWYTSLAVILVFFIVFTPLTYGWPVPAWWHDNLFWFKTWR